MQVNISYMITYNDLNKSITYENRETYESFVEGNYELEGIYAYDNDIDLAIKNQIQDKLKTVLNAAANRDSFINANFAFTGIQKILVMDILKGILCIGMVFRSQ
jgi:hypothetical protein